MKNEIIHDDIRYCERCGISFLWSSEEQKAVDAAALPPQHCACCRQLLPAVGRERGMVKWYNHRKRFGFLTRHHAPEIFFHHSELASGLRVHPDDLVEFAVDEGEKGLQAVAIHAAGIRATPVIAPVITPVSAESTENAEDEAQSTDAGI